jgi:hypothetical protein
MNATRVSKSAGLRLGLILIAMLMMVSCLPANGSEVVITVKGTLNGGRDDNQIFGLGKVMPKGTPYTIVFTFDDTKGQQVPPGCPNSGSKIVGMGSKSPGTAVITINGNAFEFGHKPDARSRAWRSISTLCSGSEIGMAVEEGHYSMVTGVNIKVTPNQGQKSLTQDRDWRSPVALSKFYARNGDNAFAIRRNYYGETMSYLSVDSVTVGGAKPFAIGAAQETAPQAATLYRVSAPISTSEIVITAKGTVRGEDYLDIFGLGKPIPKGTPFTLVYTFDVRKGGATPVVCPNSGSGIRGTGENSPGTAVITIGGVSYRFGQREGASSSAWRLVPSDCTHSEIAMEIEEGQPRARSAIRITLHPIQGSIKPLTTDADWRSPLTLTKFSAPAMLNMFSITRPGTYGLITRGFLSISSLTIAAPGTQDGAKVLMEN